MKKFGLVLFLIILVGATFYKYLSSKPTQVENGAPPYAIEDLQPPSQDRFAWLEAWTRPDVPARVGLQVGHWKNNELPDELSRLRGNTGASGGGKSEWEVNLAIAQETKSILLERNIEVDILPSTVPVQYWADVFVAIHADGSTDTSKSGFKVAAPRRDYSGNTSTLVGLIEKQYELSTKLAIDDNITRNMTGYYAFAWWRYEHSVHPKTASAILETGFLTNASDRKTIVSRPDISALGLANAIIEYLEQQGLLAS